MKTCTKCGTQKPLSEFNKMSAAPDGLAYQCKSCAKAQHQAYYLADPERAKEAARKWAAVNPERKAEIAQRARARLARRYPERIQGYNKQWRAGNPEAAKALDARRKLRRKSRLAGQTPSWDLEFDRLVEMEAQALRAARAKFLGGEWQVDHIVPLCAKHASGLHNGFNLAVVPAKYNSSKRHAFDESMLTERPWL